MNHTANAMRRRWISKARLPIPEGDALLRVEVEWSQHCREHCKPDHPKQNNEEPMRSRIGKRAPERTAFEALAILRESLELRESLSLRVVCLHVRFLAPTVDLEDGVSPDYS